MSQGKDLHLLIAKNLKFFMKQPEPGGTEPRFKSRRALAIKAGIAPNTVQNYFEPKKRTVTTEKADGYPVLDKLAKLAGALECDVWELLHPDIERHRREQKMYKDIAVSWKRISDRIGSEDVGAELPLADEDANQEK